VRPVSEAPRPAESATGALARPLLIAVCMHTTEPSFEAPRSRFSLLIVEDETCLRDAMTRRFERRGYRVRAAGSIAEARQQLERRSFDVFVFDVGLPDGDGLSLLDATRAARTLVISGECKPARLEASGVRHFLAKPFDLSEASRQVEALSRAVDERGEDWLSGRVAGEAS